MLHGAPHMLNRHVIMGSLVATLAIARSASAALPAWCATEGLDLAAHGDDHNAKDALKKDDVAWALYYLVGATCSKDTDVDEHRDELEEARKYWNQKLDMVEADWADVAVWAMQGQGQRYPNSGFYMRVEEKRPWSSYDALEQFMALRAQGMDTHYLMDALGTNLTHTGRLAYLEDCVRKNDAFEVRWAMCQPDIDAFDPGKVSAELRAAHPAGDQPVGYQRTIVRMVNYKMREDLVAHAAEVKTLIAKDEAYGKLFALSQAAHKEWEGRRKTDADLLSLVYAMDNARVTNSRKALEGCDEKTWAAWTAAVAKLPAKEFEGMHDDPGRGLFMDKAMGPIIRDPNTYLASLAVALCRATSERDEVVYNLGSSIERWPGFRGPRTAALTAMVSAGITLDDRSAHLSFPFVTREWFGSARYSRGGGSGRGVIASVKSDGKKVHVVFVAKMEKQVQCAESRLTNRIARIEPNGQLIYQEKCIKSKVVTVNTASDPQDVDVRYATGLKAGAFTSIAVGVAEAVWSSPTSEIPTVVLGVPVK